MTFQTATGTINVEDFQQEAARLLIQPIAKEENKSVDSDTVKTNFIASPIASEKCFYGLAGDFVRLVEPHTESDNMSLLSQFLTYFGNIVGRCVYYRVEGDRHYTNLFCLLVGNTASGRKGTSFGRVKEVFKNIDEKHQNDSLTSGLASGEGLLYQVRDSVVKTKRGKVVVEDVGVSDKRLLVVEGEFAQVLKKQGMESSTLSTTIRNLWDTGTTRSLTKNSPLRTTDAHVSIIGHITQTELLSILNEVESANGYANRFLFFVVKRSKLLPFGSEVPKVELGALQDRISSAIQFAKTKGVINFSIDASEIWSANYERLETSRTGYIAKITQRASPYVLRLSLIFAVLDESPVIEAAHLNAALAVWQYSEDSARFIFGNKLDNPIAERILTAMRETAESKLERTEIRDLFNRHANKAQIDAALQYLLEANLVKLEKTTTGGRSKETWIACDKSDKSD
jgi:hypothetical protein